MEGKGGLAKLIFPTIVEGMKKNTLMRNFVSGLMGLVCCVVAGWAATLPRPNPKPALDAFPALTSEDVVLVVVESTGFESGVLDVLGAVQRAKGAGADVHIHVLSDGVTLAGDVVENLRVPPGKIFRISLRGDEPGGYHPDQWPRFQENDAAGFVLLELTAEEARVKNAAVLNALQDMRNGGDEANEQRQLQLLSLARKGEIYKVIRP